MPRGVKSVHQLPSAFFHLHLESFVASGPARRVVVAIQNARGNLQIKLSPVKGTVGLDFMKEP